MEREERLRRRKEQYHARRNRERTEEEHVRDVDMHDVSQQNSDKCCSGEEKLYITLNP